MSVNRYFNSYQIYNIYNIHFNKFSIVRINDSIKLSMLKINIKNILSGRENIIISHSNLLTLNLTLAACGLNGICMENSSLVRFDTQLMHCKTCSTSLLVVKQGLGAYL